MTNEEAVKEAENARAELGDLQTRILGMYEEVEKFLRPENYSLLNSCDQLRDIVDLFKSDVETWRTPAPESRDDFRDRLNLALRSDHISVQWAGEWTLVITTEEIQSFRIRVGFPGVDIVHLDTLGFFKQSPLPLIYNRSPDRSLPVGQMIDDIKKLIVLIHPESRKAGAAPNCCEKSRSSNGHVQWGFKGWPPATWGWLLKRIDVFVYHCPFCGKQLPTE